MRLIAIASRLHQGRFEIELRAVIPAKPHHATVFSTFKSFRSVPTVRRLSSGSSFRQQPAGKGGHLSIRRTKRTDAADAAAAPPPQPSPHPQPQDIDSAEAQAGGRASVDSLGGGRLTGGSGGAPPPPPMTPKRSSGGLVEEALHKLERTPSILLHSLEGHKDLLDKVEVGFIVVRHTFDQTLDDASGRSMGEAADASRSRGRRRSINCSTPAERSALGGGAVTPESTVSRKVESSQLHLELIAKSTWRHVKGHPVEKTVDLDQAQPFLIIPSTFAPGGICRFVLSVTSTVAFKLASLPNDEDESPASERESYRESSKRCEGAVETPYARDQFSVRGSAASSTHGRESQGPRESHAREREESQRGVLFRLGESETSWLGGSDKSCEELRGAISAESSTSSVVEFAMAGDETPTPPPPPP